ncbi:hypothetical protein [Glycomyces albidus]|uniref:Uncharacterized protein n=1 Tax=Glycomyces albidus TaxID=2656774 RepID=A0A6L5G7H5_9ACTN|nr:hypothetical protein [Glycomyces albidus]MQM25615.1 hypothetical protein [Glycomyces albidus]
MRSRTQQLRIPAAVIAAGAVAAAAACTGGAADDAGPAVEPGPGAVAEAERLYQIVNDSRAMEDELIAIENRVAKRCMEDQGFTVHDPGYFADTAFAAYGASGYLVDAPVLAVPTPEAAERWGFGVWTQFVLHPGNEDLAEELLTPEARIAFNLPETAGEPDSSEWDAQGPDYQAEWIEAYTGAPALDSEVKGPEPDHGAPPGGCWLQMVETIYGEPYTVESGGSAEEEGGSHTAAHRPNPITTIEEFEDADALADLVDAEAADFDACLAGSGYEGWELGASLFPPLWEYFGAMYDPAYFEEFGDEEGAASPEPPDDVPGDFAGVLELERAMALDFAACGQESGLRLAIEEGWASMLVEAYQPIETDMLAWQEEMQVHLDNAQDYLRE